MIVNIWARVLRCKMLITGRVGLARGLVIDQVWMTVGVNSVINIRVRIVLIVRLRAGTVIPKWTK